MVGCVVLAPEGLFLLLSGLAGGRSYFLGNGEPLYDTVFLQGGFLCPCNFC